MRPRPPVFQLLESLSEEWRRKLRRDPHVRNLEEASRHLEKEEGAYVADLQSTLEGRRSSDLRKRATELGDAGRVAEAHELFLQAAALHQDTDTSAAAGAAWHDLGKSWMDLKGFLPEERYHQAEQFLRRAAACPGRRKHPYWRAMTLTMLASCLRYQTHEQGDHEAEEKLLDEAERLSEEAVASTRKIPKHGHMSSAQYLLNLGNLREQREKWNGAVEAYEQGLEEVRRLHQGTPRPGADKLTTRFYLQLARVLDQRGGRGDRKRALQLLGDVARNDPDHVNEAWLMRAEILAGDPSRREEAREAIRKVDPGRLRADHVPNLAVLFQRLDLADEALSILRRIELEAMQRRVDDITDHDADHAAIDAQRAAFHAAEILVQRGDAIAAFVELENVSGLRFLEAVHLYDHRPEDPVTRELWRQYHELATLAGYIGTVAGWFRNLPPEVQRQPVSRDTAPTAPEDGFAARVGKIVAEAVASPFPADALQRSADDLTRRTHVAIRALKARASDSDYAELFGADHVGRRELERMLSEEEDTVLVRLHLASELLLVSVWLEEGRLTGRATRLHVPKSWWNLVSSALRDPTTADAAAWTELLAALDLSAVLPPGMHRRAILLPSHLASFLPLAALGPAGKRPLDRFRSVVWLPTLAPLIRRQVPFWPRKGTLTVLGDGAAFAHVATRLELPDERRLADEAALPEKVMEQARTADVISFYAHGLHAAPKEPHLRLHGEHRLDRRHLLREWQGAERVELWACQSGVNVSLDPRTPVVDEAFGFDIEFIRVGVRTTIGTLWTVPAFVTACLVHRFRGELLQGRDGAEALAAAQRWWTAEGLPAFIESLRGRPRDEGCRAFIASLGATCRETDLEGMLATLGPVPATHAPMSEAELDRAHTRFACPLSWAGFRFHGIPERRPLKPWKEEYDQPASDEVRRQVELLLRQEKVESKKSRAADDMLEEGLKSALAEHRAHPGPPPISLLRLYQARQSGARADNLLLALARIHDTLLDPALDAGQRAPLVTEAAHLWLDLAEGERPHLLLMALQPPPTVALLRVAKLLEEATPAGGFPRADRVAAQARLLVMRELGDGALEDEQLDSMVRRAWALLEPGVDALHAPAPEAMRVATVICEVLRLAPGAVEGAAERALALADSLLEGTSFRVAQAIHVAPFLASLFDARDDLARAIERPQLMPESMLMWLPPRALARAVPRRLVAIGGAGSGPEGLWNHPLGQVEQAFWGYPSDRVPALRNTGSPGFAYHWLSSSYLGSLPPRPRGADHFIACVQFASDPRLGLCHRVAHAAAWRRDAGLADLWSDLGQREHLAQGLRDAAFLPGFQIDRATRSGAMVIHPLDPFALDAEAIRSARVDRLDLTLWELADRSLLVAGEAPRTRTAALQAVEQIERLEEEVVRRGTPVVSGRPPLVELHGVLQSLEGDLARLPRGNGVVALILGGDGTPMAAALWHGSGGVQGHVLRGEASHLGHVLAEALVTRREDDRASTRGRSPGRKKAWANLQRRLGPFLADLLGSALGEQELLHWRILAPGPLRSLPWLGLDIGGERLFQRAASVRLLPSLGFEVPIPPFPGATEMACLLAPEHREGDTTFGEAAIATLRRAAPPVAILDSDGRGGGNIVELERLGEVIPRIQSVRLYGVGNIASLTPTTAGLMLAGGRVLAPRNLLLGLLPGCEEVQLWAATSGSAESRRAGANDGDALPGLTRAFIAAGVRGVLDLAWPVPDLVKAVVCEQHARARLAGAPGAEALCCALDRARELLASWAAEARRARSVEEALARLDERRAAALAGLLSPEDLSPFAAHHQAPSLEGLTAGELAAEMLDPSHLAAFRWWGG